MVFKINQGKHRWGYALPKMHWGKHKLRYRVNFWDGCTTAPSQCHDSWNKLFGLSYGHHHRNSIRLAWRGVGDGIEIAAYVYERGERTIVPFAKVDEKVPYDMWFMFNKDTGMLVFGVDGEMAHFHWKGCKPGLGYHLWPYYGGKCPAPNDIEIILMAGYT